MQTTSSQELGGIAGISAAQIRKDISQFGEFGKQGTGYSIPFLIEKLSHILKVDRVCFARHSPESRVFQGEY